MVTTGFNPKDLKSALVQWESRHVGLIPMVMASK